MAYQSIWTFTNLPKKVVDILDEDLINSFDSKMMDSKLRGEVVNKNIRHSENTWISSDHWISGFIWHYVSKANNINFKYDLDGIEGEALQYTRYSEGMYYNWHQDSGLHDVGDGVDSTRKLSFSLQLSEPHEYEGGNVVLLSERMSKYVTPRQKGTIVLFDSRTQHCVTKVRSGVRRSIVGWVSGPRWR